MILPAIRKVLVVAAHPDDEVLGCGGTMARLAHEEVEVHVLLMADGIGSRYPDGVLPARSAAAQGDLSGRRSAASKAAEALRVSSLEFGERPDNRLDTVALLDLAQDVERAVARHEPDLVLTHHAGDLNVDHRRIHEAVLTACRPQPRHCVRALAFFEVASSTEWQAPMSAPPFVPNWFVDVSDFLVARRRALEAYAHEMRSWPHARSYDAVDHLARWRGASAGVEAAEAFMLGRLLSR